ncbi:MAG: ribonuclease III [Oscillospiraceae bacterium]|nr:ribonuclease III [Oscillospiraceae bacterium]
MTDYLHLSVPNGDMMNISSLGLAHLGDAVFEVLVRSWVCMGGTAKIKDLHKQTVRYVTAPAQAQLAEKILPMLTQEETDVFRRGRNAAPHSIPKAASRGQYQTATALEALFGWLWLRGAHDRINELFAGMMEGEEV